jgi:acetyl esterase/lipase
MQDGERVRIHITKRIGVGPTRRYSYSYHGGGMGIGRLSYAIEDWLEDLVVASGAVAVFPDYTPSPEARYPHCH